MWMVLCGDCLSSLSWALIFAYFIYRTYGKFYFAYSVQFYFSKCIQFYFAYNIFAELTILCGVDHLPRWPMAELNPYKRLFWLKNIFLNWKRFLPPQGFESGSLGTLSSWLIHNATKPQICKQVYSLQFKMLFYCVKRFF